MTTMQVGDIEVLVVNDGTFTAPDEFLGPQATPEALAAHEGLLDPDGRLRMPMGCFVVRTGDATVLMDTGVGAVQNEFFDGGHLQEGLAGLGVKASDIDIVVCSHLHLDHCGGIIGPGGVPAFPNAIHHVASADWRTFVDLEEDFMRRHVREGLRGLAEAGRVELFEGDVGLVPGISVLAAPGHTAGHSCLVVSSGKARALFLGDAISCPAQLDETEWGAMSDVDPALARRTRERLWAEMEDDGTVGAGAHFPGLAFGRVLTGTGRRWWA